MSKNSIPSDAAVGGIEAPSPDYVVSVNGRALLTHCARVSSCPFNQVWPGYQRPLDQTEIASFASCDIEGSVIVSVRCLQPVRYVRIRPQSRGIAPQVEGSTIQFTLDKPGPITVEINGTHHALHLFANPPLAVFEPGADPDIRYFGPGVHCPGLIRLESNQGIHLAEGAIVHGAIIAEHSHNLSVTGRGILDGSKFDRFDLNALISLVDCQNVRIDGIILRDSSGWTVTPVACRHIHLVNVKLIGGWRYNADGIDFVSCQHCRVERCFIRSFDDSIAIKGFKKWGPFIYRLQLPDGTFDGTFTMDGVTRRTSTELVDEFGIYPCEAAPIRDIVVRGCVIWNEWGRALEIGAETVATEITGVRFEDCDIIHFAHVALDIQNFDRAHCHDIIFRNIRIEMDDDLQEPMMQRTKDQIYAPAADGRVLPHVIIAEIVKGWCSYDQERGQIRNIHFEDIFVFSRKTPPSALRGSDAEHVVEQLSVRNFFVNGKRCRDLNTAGFQLNEFTRDIHFGTSFDEFPSPWSRAEPPKILFLGNSITFHPPSAQLGWPHNWGMAASGLQNDFVHLLLRRLTSVAADLPPCFRVENISDFERAYATYDLAARLSHAIDFRPDIVIVAIGENVPALTDEAAETAFASALKRFLSLLQLSSRPLIFFRSSFWPDPVKDAILRQVARDAGAIFVDVSKLASDEKNFALAERTFANAEVASHPGDRGMAAIAEKIWAAVNPWL